MKRIILHRLHHKPLFLFLILSLGCCQGTGSTITLQTADGEELQVRVEVADTASERARGLMFRESVPEGTGMIFLFPTETSGAFWMKNTPVSLDLLFIRDERIVAILENAVPYSEELLEPGTNYTVVLEVPGGYASRHGIAVGDGVKGFEALPVPALLGPEPSPERFQASESPGRPLSSPHRQS